MEVFYETFKGKNSFKLNIKKISWPEVKVIDEKGFRDKGVVKVKPLKIAPDPGTSHILPPRNHPSSQKTD